jgi:hypothetical protein
MVVVKSMDLLLIVVAAFSCSVGVAGDKKRNVELAPLPAQILSSKKVFIANAGGSDLIRQLLL